jgi:hypothetical protein
MAFAVTLAVTMTKVRLAWWAHLIALDGSML